MPHVRCTFWSRLKVYNQNDSFTDLSRTWASFFIFKISWLINIHFGTPDVTPYFTRCSDFWHKKQVLFVKCIAYEEQFWQWSGLCFAYLKRKLLESNVLDMCCSRLKIAEINVMFCLFTFKGLHTTWLNIYVGEFFSKIVNGL